MFHYSKIIGALYFGYEISKINIYFYYKLMKRYIYVEIHFLFSLCILSVSLCLLYSKVSTI